MLIIYILLVFFYLPYVAVARRILVVFDPPI